MKPNFLKHFWLAFAVLALAALACRGGAPAVEPVTPSNSPAAETGELSAANRSKLIAATVQILGLVNMNGELTPMYVGSGTLLSPSGMILTNAHVASPASQGDIESEPDLLVVSLVVSEDKPAVPSYQAKALAVDGYLDLAVIQITATVNGMPVDINTLNLPYVELGDSDQVRIGDSLNIFGFPSIGGNTITYTKGSVSGFSSEDQIGDRAWIKTDATISGGNSGGLAADNNGRIIGVPTIAAASRDTAISDCRKVQDTNNDGFVDEQDSCIPIGGFLNGIRPINLALPLIQAVRAGRTYTSPYRLPGMISEAGSGNESATGFVWLDTSISTPQECNWTNTPVNSYPATALCIAASFEYAGMTNSELVLEHWYQNGQKIAEYSYAWEWSESGLLGVYLPNNGNPIPPGSYYVELFAGAPLKSIGRSSEVKVGSGQPSQPTLPSGGTITVYGVVYDAATNKPIAGAYVFVLSPGITYLQWQSANYADKYIVTYLQTGSDGKYKITGIPRNTLFTLVYAAHGYYDAYADNLQAGPDDAEWNELNVGLNK